MDGGKFAYEAYSSGKAGGTLKRRDGGVGGNSGGQQQGPSVSKKSTADHQHRGGKSCQCFGGTKRSKTKVFLTNLATNLGICLLLFGYTLVGSIVFLAIEGNSSISHQILATTSLASNSANVNGAVSFTKPQPKNSPKESGGGRQSVVANVSGTSVTSLGVGQHTYELTESFKIRADAVRAKTVENIWNITVNLNILYRDNWTRLAAQEISRFQDELVRALVHEEAALQLIAAGVADGPSGPVGTEHRELASSSHHHGSVGLGPPAEFEWTFARSFLYSLTVLTTIGYGSVAPRTTLGKTVTMIYAILGIPLTLLYLSSVGAILSRIARGVFSRALCCCLCSNCGYCCYDEQRMADKERRMRKKRQHMELQAQAQLVAAGGSSGGGGGGGAEPFYVRGGGEFGGVGTTTFKDDLTAADSGSLTDCESKASSMQGLSILAPVTLCLAMMFLYICVGAFVLHRLERWPPLDAFYFCFMSLTTIGFGNMLPGGASSPVMSLSSTPSTFPSSAGVGGSRPPPPPSPPAQPPAPPPHSYYDHQSNVSTWFCSLYIMSGMALTAMCFNVVHDEIVHRLRHVTASVAAAGSAHHHHHHHRGVQGRAKGQQVSGGVKVGYLDDLGVINSKPPQHPQAPMHLQQVMPLPGSILVGSAVAPNSLGSLYTNSTNSSANHTEETLLLLAGTPPGGGGNGITAPLPLSSPFPQPPPAPMIGELVPVLVGSGQYNSASMKIGLSVSGGNNSTLPEVVEGVLLQQQQQQHSGSTCCGSGGVYTLQEEPEDRDDTVDGDNM